MKPHYAKATKRIKRDGEMTEKPVGTNQENARLLPRLSTTNSTAPVTTGGRELDALVAEKVMGFSWQGKPRGNRSFHDAHGKQVGVKERGKPFVAFGSIHSTFLPHYSTSIADAWLVVEKLRAKGFHPLIESRQANELWAVNFSEAEFGMNYTHCAVEKSAPLSICIAALQAVGG